MHGWQTGSSSRARPPLIRLNSPRPHLAMACSPIMSVDFGAPRRWGAATCTLVLRSERGRKNPPLFTGWPRSPVRHRARRAATISLHPYPTMQIGRWAIIVEGKSFKSFAASASGKTSLFDAQDQQISRGALLAGSCWPRPLTPTPLHVLARRRGDARTGGLEHSWRAAAIWRSAVCGSAGLGERATPWPAPQARPRRRQLQARAGRRAN